MEPDFDLDALESLGLDEVPPPAKQEHEESGEETPADGHHGPGPATSLGMRTPRKATGEQGDDWDDDGDFGSTTMSATGMTTTGRADRHWWS